MREIFEVRQEAPGWLSIYRGQNSCGAQIRCAAALIGFSSTPDSPTKESYPRLIIWGTDCGRMPHDGGLRANWEWL